jgi:regulator of replication initiation timing
VVLKALGVLEKRVSDLLGLVKKLKDENSKLRLESEKLKSTIDGFEVSMLKSKQELDQEKELTKVAVDGLIKSIDSLVELKNER